jgi:hypothetical protein
MKQPVRIKESAKFAGGILTNAIKNSSAHWPILRKLLPLTRYPIASELKIEVQGFGLLCCDCRFGGRRRGTSITRFREFDTIRVSPFPPEGPNHEIPIVGFA